MMTPAILNMERREDLAGEGRCSRCSKPLGVELCEAGAGMVRSSGLIEKQMQMPSKVRVPGGSKKGEDASVARAP